MRRGALGRNKHLKRLINGTLVHLSFIALLIVASPLVIVNVADYRWHIKKQPFYKSLFVRWLDQYPLFYDLVTFFFDFPLHWRIYNLLPRMSGKVLQVGCGTGLMNKYLAATPKHNIDEIMNLDININLLSRGYRKGYLASYVHSSILDVPIEDCYFDTIVFARCFHHIRNHKKALFECGRLLKNGGTIVIADLVSLSLKENDAFLTNSDNDGIIWRYNIESFKTRIQACLDSDMQIKHIYCIRQPHVSNYNFIFPHTDVIAIIQKKHKR